MNIPAMDDAKEQITADNPFNDAELILYTSTAEWAEGEPTHDVLGELGLASFSLWARWEEDNVEIPILGEASWHMWYSLSAEGFNPDPSDPVSDAFVSGIVEMVDEEVDDGWGDINPETWENMRDVEQYIVHLTRDAFLKMDNPEPALIIDWCKNNRERGDE